MIFIQRQDNVQQDNQYVHFVEEITQLEMKPCRFHRLKGSQKQSQRKTHSDFNYTLNIQR